MLWQSLSLSPGAGFIIGLTVAITANIAVVLVMLSVASEPLRIISQAIAHVSHDPVITPPPDITSPRYAHSGLKEIVQTIYELAVAAPGEPEETAPANTVGNLLDELPCGVIAITAQGNVVYANQIAPVIRGDNELKLSLIFDQTDDLDKWIADCKANKVRDDHLWQRVADKLPGEPNRKIYDIAGHYQKNAKNGADIVLVAFDRTSAYAPDQDSMDFIALAAHELRGPITVIRGYLDVFDQEIGEKLNDDQRVLLERLEVSAERLSGYINNILNVSRYDRNRFTLHLAEEKLKEIFDGIMPDLDLRARTQHRRLSLQIPDKLPTIAADRSSLSEVIINLIDNAIKYSHENGEIKIAVAPKEDFVEVTVTDNGIGMPGAIVGNLFNKFYRSHRSREAVGGTGLGLYICKAIIDSHGGSIWVRSKEGQGSTFGFTLPIYSTVAQKLANGDNKDITQRSEGWIKNHAMYRR